jgi:2-dehydro-3-deoxyphosphogluconate aldolase/(4S)-4-hydroxy-2-oxoglutarate aldolase
MTPKEASRRLLEVASRSPVIPVLVIDDAGRARDLAQALVDGGLFAIEVTLRTPQALTAITEMAGVKGAVVGAGTVLTPADARAAHEAGASFAVSPGSTPALLDTCEDIDLPMLPGAVTATEAMTLFERGYSFLKFFPAEASGGIPGLRALAAPLPQIRFCPTGGVSAGNAGDYLGLPNVACVGGSWVAPAKLVEAGDWAAITELARKAASLRP